MKEYSIIQKQQKNNDKSSTASPYFREKTKACHSRYSQASNIHLCSLQNIKEYSIIQKQQKKNNDKSSTATPYFREKTNACHSRCSQASNIHLCSLQNIKEFSIIRKQQEKKYQNISTNQKFRHSELNFIKKQNKRIRESLRILNELC